MKKYELTNESIQHAGRTLYRIKRLSDGLLGGYVESEKNLSQEGSCFIYDNAKVYSNAWVSGSAEVSGSAKVSGNTKVFGKARVSGEAWVFGKARVSGEAVATKLVQSIITYRYNITLTDTHIAIGCENHTIDYWKKHIKDIGVKHGYTVKERNAVRHLLRGLLMIRGEG